MKVEPAQPQKIWGQITSDMVGFFFDRAYLACLLLIQLRDIMRQLLVVLFVSVEEKDETGYSAYQDFVLISTNPKFSVFLIFYIVQSNWVVVPSV